MVELSLKLNKLLVHPPKLLVLKEAIGLAVNDIICLAVSVQPLPLVAIKVIV